MLTTQDPIDATNTFISKIKQIITRSTGKFKKCKNLRWVTKVIVTSCVQQELLYNIWKLDPKNFRLKNDYETIVKYQKKVIKIVENTANQTKVESFRNNIMEVYS